MTTGNLAIKNQSPDHLSPNLNAYRCLSGRSAAWDERPIETVSKRNCGRMQPIGVERTVALLVFFETRAEGAKRVTEEAMLIVDAARIRSGPYVMGALVVVDENRPADEIVELFGMWQHRRAGAEADEQEDRDARTLPPGLRANHRF